MRMEQLVPIVFNAVLQQSGRRYQIGAVFNDFGAVGDSGVHIYNRQRHYTVYWSRQIAHGSEEAKIEFLKTSFLHAFRQLDAMEGNYIPPEPIQAPLQYEPLHGVSTAEEDSWTVIHDA